MKPRLDYLVVALGGLAGCFGNAVAADMPEQAALLRPVTAFSNVSNVHTRSVALFTEAAKVIQHPRCMNCHPVTRQPTQGDDLHPHIPLMYAGVGDHGAPGLPCNSCHGNANVETPGSRIAGI